MRRRELRVDRVGGAVRLSGELDRGAHDRAVAIAGARFSPRGHVDYPLSLTACYALRDAFGDRLVLGAEINAWARAEKRRIADMAALAERDDVELANVSDRLRSATASRTYQRVAAAFIARAGSCLVADQPGLGKTIELLAGVQEANPSCEQRWHLVLAPSIAVEAVWPREVAHWLGDSAAAFPITGTYAERHTAMPGPVSVRVQDVFVIGNIEMVRIRPWMNRKGKPEFHVADKSAEGEKATGAYFPELFAREWDTVVVDESHRALIKKGGGQTQTRAGMTKLEARARIALSGTPMRGEPVHLWGTLNWLRPDMFASYWTWVGQYYDVFSTKFSAYNIGDFLPGGEDRMADDLAPYMLRRTKAEVLPELPPKQYVGEYLIPGDDESPHGVWLSMTPNMTKRYQKFVDEGTVKLPGGWVIANGVLAERTRQLQLAASYGDMSGEDYVPALPSPKLDWLLDKIAELDDQRIVVASHSTALLELFAGELRRNKIDVHLLTGKTSGRERARMAADFQSDDPSARVFLLNSKAGGVALTLDAADHLVMLDESTVPDDDEQVEDRIHRTSRMHQVMIYKLRMLDTLEEEVAWIAAARQSVQSYIMDGARGVEYARKVYAEQKQEADTE